MIFLAAAIDECYYEDRTCYKLGFRDATKGEEDPAALLQEHDVARWTRRSTTTAGDGTGSREGRSVRPQAGDEEGEGENAIL